MTDPIETGQEEIEKEMIEAFLGDLHYLTEEEKWVGHCPEHDHTTEGVRRPNDAWYLYADHLEAEHIFISVPAQTIRGVIHSQTTEKMRDDLRESIADWLAVRSIIRNRSAELTPDSDKVVLIPPPEPDSGVVQ